MQRFDHDVRIHGHAFFLQLPGPGPMRNVSGIDWTDQQGFRQGFGVTFRGQPGRDNFFHASLPSMNNLPLYNPFMQRIGDSGTALKQITVYYQLQGPARIFHLGVFDGGNRFFERTQRPNIDIVSGRSVRLDSPRIPLVGFGISLGVTFGEPDSSILIQGAVATYTTTFWEPSDPRP